MLSLQLQQQINFDLLRKIFFQLFFWFVSWMKKFSAKNWIQNIWNLFIVRITQLSVIWNLNIHFILIWKKRTLLLLCILQITDPLIWIEIRVQLSVRENLQLYSIDEMLTNSLCILIVILVFSIVFIHIMTTISGTISLKNVYL